ncbi:MAG: hypothetical protein K8H88_19390 [Sandaracinaceae bacterium]|nr:hypothetical protein [Sandaracinaceae bacterium]
MARKEPSATGLDWSGVVRCDDLAVVVGDVSLRDAHGHVLAQARVRTPFWLVRADGRLFPVVPTRVLLTQIEPTVTLGRWQRLRAELGCHLLFPMLPQTPPPRELELRERLVCPGDSITVHGDLFHAPPTESHYRSSSLGPGAILAHAISLDAVGPRERTLVPSPPPHLEAERRDERFGSAAAIAAAGRILQRIVKALEDD